MTSKPNRWPPQPGEVWVGRSGAQYLADPDGPMRRLGDDGAWAGNRSAEDVWDDDGPLIPPSRGLAAAFRREAHELDCRPTAGPGERDTLLADAEELRIRADSVSTSWPVRALPTEVAS